MTRMMSRTIGLFLAVVALVVATSSNAKALRIVPNEPAQSFLRSLLSNNPQVMFEGTDIELSEKLKTLRMMAGQDTSLALQLMYFSAYAKDQREAMLPGIILQRLSISDATIAKICMPLLEDEDDTIRRLAADWLTRVDRNPEEGVDFSQYESILRERKGDPPFGLIRYMYDRNPKGAVVAIARTFSPEVSGPEIEDHAKANIKEAAAYFVKRPEWWAHLFVASMMDKERYLRTPQLIGELEGDTHPLVMEKISKWKSKLCQ